MNRALSTGLLVSIGLGLSGCDYSGDWLFAAATDGVPGVVHILPEDGSEDLVPSVITNVDELEAATIYLEIGATGTVEQGGATFTFRGTGGPVCIWADPEVAFWNQAVATNPDDGLKQWAYPDNTFDDGDVDVYAGLSAYYTGSPGVRVGDFKVAYTDSLGNEVPIELSACRAVIGMQGQTNAHAGRGYPEKCDIDFTDPGVSYTGLLQAFSTPIDDDRLGVAFVVADGSCASLAAIRGGDTESLGAECLLQGESLFPDQVPDPGPHFGFDSARAWGGSEAFEVAFCSSTTDTPMKRFCKSEADDMLAAGRTCEWEEVIDPNNRCFCGNPVSTPSNGAI